MTLLVSKGHSREVCSELCFPPAVFYRFLESDVKVFAQVLDACLDEYASLDVWVLDEERNITFVD